MEYQKLLQNWGLTDYIQAFVDEEITDRSFLLLDNDTIDRIFKKHGPRLIFKNQFMKHLGINERLYELQKNNAPCCSTTMHDQELYNMQNPNRHYETDEKFLEIFDSLTSDTEKHYSGARFKRPSVFYPENLEIILRKSIDGKLVLTNNVRLLEKHRQIIANVVVDNLLTKASSDSHGGRISIDTFSRAAEEIIELFPTERIETYFSRCHSKTNKSKKLYSKGKLWSRYCNKYSTLKLTELSKSGRMSLNQDHTLINPTPEEGEKLKYLTTTLEPYMKIAQFWQETYVIRKTIFRKKSSFEIFQTFACLRQNFGLDLIEIDFNNQFPNLANIIYTEWPKVSEAILLELKERKIINAVETDTEITLQALLNLSKLFRPVTIKNGKSLLNGKKFRPTRDEIQQSFFCHLKKASDLDETIQERRKKLEFRGLSVQPFAVAVGELNNVFTYYIVVHDFKFQVDSSIRCLELLFKTFHVLHIEYPSESTHIWQFLEYTVFKMKNQCSNSSASALISDIFYHLQKK